MYFSYSALYLLQFILGGGALCFAASLQQTSTLNTSLEPFPWHSPI